MYHGIKFEDVKLGDKVSFNSFEKLYTGVVVAHYGDYLVVNTGRGEWSVSEDQITYIRPQEAD